jgi:hypothetical protein
MSLPYEPAVQLPPSPHGSSDDALVETLAAMPVPGSARNTQWGWHALQAYFMPDGSLTPQGMALASRARAEALGATSACRDISFPLLLVLIADLDGSKGNMFELQRKYRLKFTPSQYLDIDHKIGSDGIVKGYRYLQQKFAAPTARALLIMYTRRLLLDDVRCETRMFRQYGVHPRFARNFIIYGRSLSVVLRPKGESLLRRQCRDTRMAVAIQQDLEALYPELEVAPPFSRARLNLLEIFYRHESFTAMHGFLERFIQGLAQFMQRWEVAGQSSLSENLPLRISEAEKVDGIESNMGQYCGAQAATAVGQAVADTGHASHQHHAPAACNVGQAEQDGGATDGGYLGVLVRRQQTAYSTLQIPAEQGFFGQTDQQQIVEQPQPDLRWHLGLPAEQSERAGHAHADDAGEQGIASNRSYRLRHRLRRAYPWQTQYQPEADQGLVKVEVEGKWLGLLTQAHGIDDPQVVETWQPVQAKRQRQGDEERMSTVLPGALRLSDGPASQQQQ